VFDSGGESLYVSDPKRLRSSSVHGGGWRTGVDFQDTGSFTHNGLAIQERSRKKGNFLICYLIEINRNERVFFSNEKGREEKKYIGA
jgi:hypothetical protein